MTAIEAYQYRKSGLTADDQALVAHLAIEINPRIANYVGDYIAAIRSETAAIARPAETESEQLLADISAAHEHERKIKPSPPQDRSRAYADDTAPLSLARPAEGEEASIRKAIADWLEEDAPTGARENVHSGHILHLVRRLLSASRPTQAEDGVAAERERCAKIAEAHKGSAAAKRRQRGQQFKFLPDEVVAEIQAEEHGEDIAAEMIAQAIRGDIK